ncbi:RagB/SusD family nutrient uptake outer membrane protein [Flavivirga spongiicola]|uniref:RagB/SusD family nutrient uptake outer membrane protein n=1 Tax=Flavivirga spongiicola TaxID=421621 RepID=A0ABU7XLW0_9FLAO|nr:RagB/SusD family nutrient uptake outer membrane protein [Flavivirga sp. MEBiC05379]MDO5981399.1 RagB/SusD family nutrient uptake outer membrane protein [Flavivirga sp. MEBiC05379]
MKKLIRYITLFLTIASISCDDEFLNHPDQDNITSDNFWKTTQDLELYVNQFYPQLPSWSPGAWNGGIYWSDGNIDNIIHENSTRSGTIVGLNTVETGNGRWNYSTIRSLNIFFANYETVDADFDEYKHFVGEAHFFRAWSYFTLLRTYGGVPWIDKPLLPDSEELEAPRASRSEIATNILADLDKAIEFMASGKNKGGNRLNKECARLLKARVALYEGTWEKYHNGTSFGVSGSDGASFIQIAADASKSLIDNPGGFSINNTGNPGVDYETLFNQADYSSNPEVMLWRRFDLALSIAHNGQRYLPRIGGARGVTKELVDDFLAIDGLPIASSPLYMGDQGLVNVTTNRDPRLSEVIWVPGQLQQTGRGAPDEFFDRAPLEIGGEGGCPTGYMIRKGASTNRDYSHTSGVGVTSSPTFRFAEALLIYAEAKAELGSISQQDVDESINVLRSRAGMPNLNIGSITADPNWAFPSLSPILNEVRRERHVELAVEGYRFDDIMRWSAAEDLVVGKRYKGVYFVQSEFPELTPGTNVLLDTNGYVDPNQNSLPGGFQFDPMRDYLLAVPLDEITLNPALTQNPGWE